MVFTVQENERNKLAHILDNELTHEEQEEQILVLLHELIHSLPDSKHN